MAKFDRLHIGVLALQGDYELHERQLALLGVKSSLVRLPGDLDGIDGLIMPGGESTTMEILIDRFKLRLPLLELARFRPIYGTCAGMILLSQKIEENDAGIRPLELIDIDIVRNGYGRQRYSFEKTLEMNTDGLNLQIRAAFIRAPRVTRLGNKVRSLAFYQRSAVLVSQGNILAASFHAELSDEAGLLRYFLERYFDNKTNL
jgi:5'-phosphate synthase pdxT subunit